MFTVLFTFAIKLAIAQHDSIICDGVLFNDDYFDREIIVKGFGRPCNLIMHKYSGILFFSHTLETDSTPDFAIAACRIEKGTCEDVKGVPGGYAISYDPGNDDIYFGGHDGIYKYNFLSRSAEFFGEQGKSVWDINIRRNFYYIEYPTQKLFVYKEDYFVPVLEARKIEIDRFYVSKRKDIYFSNKTAVYKVEKNQRDPAILNDEIVVRQISEDTFGDVYLGATDGIYLDQKPFLVLKKVADLVNLFGLAFDESDHVIYSDERSIYRLTPSKNSEVCYDMLKRNKK